MWLWWEWIVRAQVPGNLQPGESCTGPCVTCPLMARPVSRVTRVTHGFYAGTPRIHVRWDPY